MEYPTWYKQSGFRFDVNERSLYVDPWQVPQGEPQADFIFITHAHYDHFDPDAIERLRTEKTQIVATSDVAKKTGGENITVVAPGERREIGGISFETIPAYNVEKEFHSQASNWVGYVFTFNSTRYYHAGDTDAIPEMRDIKTDIAILPIGGTYTMDVSEALRAIDMIKPQIVIPMHYGFIVGSPEDADRLKEKSSVPVEILKSELPFGEK